MADVRVVLIKPGDLLVIGNTGSLDPEAIEHVGPGLTALKDALGLGGIVVFEGDIDLAAVAAAGRTAADGHGLSPPPQGGTPDP